MVSVMVSAKDVVRVSPPPVPVTVIVHEPVGVVEDVVMANWLVNVGLPRGGLNDAEAPEGSPDADNATA